MTNLLALRPRPTLRVDLGAVTANVRTIRSRTAGELMAVVKADGFGHGQVDVARAALAGGATRLGVTSLDEARPLRESGLTERILSWLNPPGADFAAAVRLGIELGVPGRDHLDAIARTAPGARIHLHLDTGMGRDGAEPAGWELLCRAAREAERHGRVRVVGIMGHLPCADRPGHAANARGRDRFVWGLRVARAAGLRPADHHLAATAATLSDPASHHTMSRIGAGLVGIDESGTVRLRPALTLTAPLVTIRSVAAGTAVGYGHTWTARRATRLGLLPVGYADGLPRLASGRAEVWAAGMRRPVAGRISMDMTVVDLSADAAVSVGDPVTVFGPGDHGEPTTAEWARWAETLEHEIVTGLSARLHRRNAA
ncbi:alanine racemase [Mangrovihabitans endophyticus]|uniref:Alanine racemase n=1 Tax=Mangrovihabitans endophyticus TaxID=1751298 RepID=A0A8J3C0W4_9ACTN|nr:alanine racemase [Mangrovihabitans endophyticus]GGL02542.1 alanine racemase [Mangrovihabitans endophyticus]